MLEHSPVYTIGIRSDEYSERQQEELRDHGAQVIKIARGGLITYHGPGQLIAYPIINLRGSELVGKGIRWYVKALEQAGFETCEVFKPNAFQKGSELFADKTAATGVWVNEDNKIMSIGTLNFDGYVLFSLGVHSTRGVAYHGVSLNCSNEPLKWFDKIVPCGLTNCKMTTLETVTGTKLIPDDIAPVLSERLFANLFKQGDDLECTYADFLAEDESLPWEKVSQFILEDADFRTKRLPSQEAPK
nr:octanoyltransferase mitochondrial [Hymenolepis microstoma]CUU99912.1 octanoyltransferase mitochondrial [Hymenolepis microstoma]